MKNIGELIVANPFSCFVKWVKNKKGIIYSQTKDGFGHISKITVKNYRQGSYEGVIGVTVIFNGKEGA